MINPLSPENKADTLEKVKYAGVHGLTLVQTASYIGADLNQYIQIYFSDPDYRKAFAKSGVETSMKALDRVIEISQSEDKQALHAAIYVHKHMLKIHASDAGAIDPKMIPNGSAAKIAALVDPATMKQIAQDHAERNKS